MCAGEVHDSSGAGMATEDKRGVGAIDTTAAYHTLYNSRARGLTLRRPDFRSKGWYEIPFRVEPEHRTRVVIVWSAHITDEPSEDPGWLNLDRFATQMDLSVVDSDGQLVGGSFESDRNYELVEFFSDEGGVYTARIYVEEWNLRTEEEERVGFAWYEGLPLP